ncbi:MAG: hypothetical protein ACREE4_05525 [Stellaceae bacterium]
MTTKRKIGTMAALGGLAAAVTLLAGSPATRADELADLKANQALLQKKLDQMQLALGAAPVAPGSPSMTGSFPRSILIPGTDTSIAIGGYVNMTASYWFTGGPVNGNPVAPVIGENGQALSTPLELHGQKVGGVTFSAPTFNPRSRGNGVIQMTARQSRLRVETRTPTAWGEAGTVFEFDWLGCNNLSCNALDHVSNSLLPRLRLAYGTLGPWLAGQAFGTTDDLAANPETIDFGGPVGEWGVVRMAQLRYTGQLPWGLSFAVAAEQPATDIFTPAGAIQTDSSTETGVGGVGIPSTLAVNPTKSSMPDWAGYFQINRPWGHFRVQGVLRDLKIEDGRFLNKEFLGYGGGFAGNVKPWLIWPKDNLQFQFGAGSALGRYGNSGSNNALVTNFGCDGPTEGCAVPMYGAVGGPTSAAAAALIRFQKVPEWFGAVGYQHWWAPDWRSNVAFGIQHQDVSSLLLGPTQTATSVNKQVYTAHANVIWSPVSFVNIGLEYMHAQRKTVANIPGTEDEVEGEFMVKF